MAAIEFTTVVDDISRVIDGVCVAVVVVAMLFAAWAFVRVQGRPPATPSAYRLFRQRVGKAILLGLEFLVAADIIRTVAVAPSFPGVGVLAVVVAVRTFLSFTVDVELEGRWPWQQRTGGRRPDGPPRRLGASAAARGGTARLRATSWFTPSGRHASLRAREHTTCCAWERTRCDASGAIAASGRPRWRRLPGDDQRGPVLGFVSAAPT